MAGIICSASTPEIALVAATAKTVAQLKSLANQRLKLIKWGVSFDGVSPSAEPVQVRLLRQTTVIGGTPTAVTPVKINIGSETIQSTFAYSAGGSEPTASDVLDVKEVHPQSGYECIFPLGQEIIVTGGASVSYLGIECTAPAVVNVRAVMWWEE